MRVLKSSIAVMLFVFLVLPAAGLASGDETHIESFDVDITVGEDNSYHVVQNIRMAFSEYGGEHGAFEVIDLRPHVFFNENDEFYVRDYRVDISNIRVNEPFETSVEDGQLRIRIGDPDVVVEGQTIDYEISYDYNAGDDGFADFDMFYYAIIGNEWQMPIDRASFRIEMPKEFDPDKVGFSVGWSGSEGYDPQYLSFSIDDNVITGRINRQLGAYEGVWIRISLPAGYFSAARILDTAALIVVWTSVGVVGVMAVLYLIFRPRHRPVITVEVSPPPELTPADAGYIIDGVTENRDILSLLMYWADKGYLKIVEILPDDPKKKDRDLLFVRLADLPPSANDYEILLFDALFETGDRVSTKDLKYKFYPTMQATRKRIDNKFTDPGKRVFDPFSKLLSEICGAMGALPVALMAAVTTYYEFYDKIMPIVAGVFLFLFGLFLSFFFTGLMRNWLSEKRTSRTKQTVLWAVFAAGYYLFAFFMNIEIFGAFVAIPIVCSMILMLLAPRFIKRTKLGLDWTGKLLGLKRFIERAEKQRLELLVEENPAYFYNILPYAYVLGVTDVWSSRFEGLAVPPPSWYAGADFDTFSAVYFTSVMMNSMQRAQSAMVAQQSSGGSGGGGGGFSGGGFSGGGFGGSGGGSW